MQEILDKLAVYRFRGRYVPNHLHQQIAHYVTYGITPSEFLYGILCKDLDAVISHADDEVVKNIPAVYAFFYNQVPSSIWGNPGKVYHHQVATIGIRDAYANLAEDEEDAEIVRERRDSGETIKVDIKEL